ncbi:MAG: hypothetical protein SFV54_16445 [Bryobacteraceae bacterium]|nr:hypothetical protein [Bryobacteraceae bacterium]
MTARIAMLVVISVAVGLAQDCVSVVDDSWLGQADPCGYDNWALRAIVWNSNNYQYYVYAGVVGVRNACTGTYTDCAGNLHYNGEQYQGNKQMFWSFWPKEEATVWWQLYDKDLYMEGCITPSGGQGYNPQVITRTWTAGYSRVYCNY